MAMRLPVLGRAANKICNIVLRSNKIPLINDAKYFQTSTSLLAIQLKMPSLSPTMTEGTIVQWHKKEGETIIPGDIICDIQTDKAVVGFEVDEEGTLAKIIKPEGSSNVKVSTLIALMVDEGEDWQNVEIPADAGSSPVGSQGDSLESKPETPETTASAGNLHHSYGPAVRSILDMYNIKIEDVKATGPHSRVLKGDLLQHIKDKNLKPVPLATKEPPPPISTPTPPPRVQSTPLPASQPLTPAPAAKTMAPLVPEDGSTFTDIDLTNMRKVIAKRLTESKMSTPHQYSTIDCNMGQLLKLRNDLKADGTKVSVNDFIIKAVAVSLQRVPEVNALWTEDGGRVVSNIDISVAVATDAGLITPIVKDAINLGVEEISTTIKELAGRAREGRLQPHEFQGGTFTISNLGMFGISEFTAVINPPQACILAIGGSRAALDHQGEPQTLMKVTMSADARIVNEFLASQFLETFKETMENPMLMLSQGPKLNLESLFAK